MHSGLVETLFKDHVADKTNWQAMLKGDAEPCDLEQARQRLGGRLCRGNGASCAQQLGLQSITELRERPGDAHQLSRCWNIRPR